MKKKRTIKIVTIVLSIILVLAAFFAASYALFTNETVATDANSYTTGLLAITANSKTDKISLTSAIPITDEAGIETEPYIFTVKNIGNLDYKFDLKLLSTGDASTNNVILPRFIKLQVDDGEVTTLASSNGIIKEDITLNAGESMEVKLRVWLSIDTTNDQIGRTFTSQIVANGEAIYTETNNKVTLAGYITNLYNPNDTAKNGNDTLGYTTYNLDTNNLLMTDIDGNIRYYGNNPKNYIYFNCDNYPETGCEKWRIIGVFGDKVKLIRNESLGQYPFDTPELSSDWTVSDIKGILNGAYLNNEDTSYYRYVPEDNTTIPVDINFNSSKTGIKSKTAQLIEDVIYNLGTFNQTSSIYVKESYELERGTQIPEHTFSATWNGKIGLPYSSDYGFAVNLKECNKTLFEYHNSVCTSNNWIKSVFGNEYHTFFLNPYAVNNTVGVLAVANVGGVANTHVRANMNILPVLYLKDTTVMSRIGDGSEGNPYRLIVK